MSLFKYEYLFENSDHYDSLAQCADTVELFLIFLSEVKVPIFGSRVDN